MVKDTAKYGLGKVGLTPLEAVLEKRRQIDAALEAGRPPEQCRGCGYYRSPSAREKRRLKRLAAERQRLAAAQERKSAE